MMPLVVAIESARTAQPTKRALYDPAPRQHLEGVELGPLQDLDVQRHIKVQVIVKVIFYQSLGK